MPYTRKFTEQEVNNIVTKWVIRSLNATKEQAQNPKTSLEYDLNATSFGVLDLLINLWEATGLNFRKIPAVHWHNIQDIRKVVMDALANEYRLIQSDVINATKKFDALHNKQTNNKRNK